MSEVWRPIPNTYYEVSSFGRFRRVLLLKPVQNTGGYLTVGFRRGDSYNHKKLVHTLVAEVFLGPKEFGYVVNHKDGCKLNNHVDNLEYVTPKENAEHAVKMGLYRRGQTHPKSKLTGKQVACARRQYKTGRYTFAALAKEYGVSKATINKAVRGVTY